ncbi:MAG: arylesterase [Alphaproteobacteria bacterium]|nr:arylesterase [Alphaproteobacteria bacterium]
MHAGSFAPPVRPKRGIGRSLGLVLPCVLAAALALPVRAGAESVVVAFGDSLVAGWGLPAEASFPRQLEAALRARGVAARVVDAGVSGETTAGGLARLDWTFDGYAGAALAILELGANDGPLRGLDPQQTEANLDAMLTALQRRGMAVLLAGMRAPPNLGPDYVAAFDAIYPRLAARHGVVFYPFFLDGVAAVPRLNQADGIHPNAAGVAVIVERIVPFVLLALAAPGRRRGAS